jgi:1-deoxy-D-xylulose-5-phosphate reductoisomerase
VIKRVIVLGSTGSIGTSTLEVIDGNRDRFEVVGLACGANIDLFNDQVERFRPAYAWVGDGRLRERISPAAKVRLSGTEGLREMVRTEADIILNALPGSHGLEPSLETLRAGKTLALANKESLVMAGRIIGRLVEEGRGSLIPVDSEHSALFQLLRSVPKGDVTEIVLTASGGPFRDFTSEAMRHVRPEEALNHPTWRMGRKVTLDSATLMNKGLEVIEARWLFDTEATRIKVLIHPESIVHGLAVLRDGSLMAYLAQPDMKIPISYALNSGERHDVPLLSGGLDGLRSLTFRPPDVDRFPSLRLAYEALGMGDSGPIVLNAANEVAVEAFMARRIGFTDVPALVARALENHAVLPLIEDVGTVWEVDRWARTYTETLLRTEYA